MTRVERGIERGESGAAGLTRTGATAALAVLGAGGLGLAVALALAAATPASVAAVAGGPGPGRTGVASGAGVVERARAVSAANAAVRADWAVRGLTPVEPATDAEWLRRATLDVAGRIPTLDELRAFESAPGKTEARRAAAIARKLAAGESATHRAWELVDLLVVRAPSRKGWDERPLHGYLTAAFAAGRGYDAVVRDLLTAEGTTAEVGAANYLAMAGDNPADMASRVATHFLGLGMECAQCHDHPDGLFTRERFWGLASFFARTSFVADPTAMGPYRFHLVELPYGEVRMGMVLPGAGPSVPPTYPDGTPGPASPEVNRRKALAAWVTSPKNPWFARTRVDQVATALLGAPLPAAATDALAAFFAASGFDERRLWEAVAATEAYGLSSRPGRPGGAPSVAATARSLALRDVFRSVAVATGAALDDADGYGAAAAPGTSGKKGKLKAKAKATVAKAEAGGGGERGPYLMGALDAMADTGPRRAEGMVALASGVTDPSLVRSLFLMNGRLLDAATLPFPGSTLATLVKRDDVSPAAVDEVFRAVLGRTATPAERDAMTAHLRAAPSAVAGWSDVLWTLFNSSEFLFNL